MKTFRKLFVASTITGAACFLNVIDARADFHSCKASVKYVKGAAHYSVNQGQWIPLKTNLMLEVGTLIKTAPESTVTLHFRESGHQLIANPNTVLRLVKLASTQTGLELISDAGLELIQGSVAGSQRKTSVQSAFKINGVSVPNSGGYKINSKGEVNTVVAQESQLLVTKSSAPVIDATEFLTAGRAEDRPTSPHGNNGVGNGEDPAPPGNDGNNDGPGTGPGNPGRGRPTRP